MNKLTLLVIMMSCPVYAFSNEPEDSITSTDLKEIVVEGRTQSLGSEVSTYIPTSRQKNASQTATDLLDRMAIPQLRISPKGEISDLAGKNVDIFIDFIPANKDDLEGMRIADVKKVEYYDYPADPRFQGKAHIVNFIMQKYEYGGYIKGFGWGVTDNAGQLSLFAKLQYKKMTFDIAAGGFWINHTHDGENTYETFRIPQSDGSMKIFERNSIQTKATMRENTYWPTFKARYATDKIIIQNTIGAFWNFEPKKNQSGYVTYTPEIVSTADYFSTESNRQNSLSYSGYWNFILNDKNSITFSPRYAYSHTNIKSLYVGEGAGEYYNAATDNAHEYKSDLTYSHSFGKWGKLNALLQTMFATNKTQYSGTANINDNSSSLRIGPGIQYSVSIGKVYGLLGLGLLWDRQEYMKIRDNSAAPWFDISLQYAPTNRHSIRCETHYMKSNPFSSSRSNAIIQINPLMSYTGNPNIKSFDSYDLSLNYSFIPNNKFSLSAFGHMWITKNRYVYDYRPTSTGIIRTILQPGGPYEQWTCGTYASVRLFERKLQLSAQVIVRSVHNGAPYNLNKTNVGYSLQANYYAGNWNFSGVYSGPQGYPDGCMIGTWMKTKSFYMLQAGWSNSSWNIRLQVMDFAKWNWESDKGVMHSEFYDIIEQKFSINDHASARLSVTYTFGFGKKVSQDDEAGQQRGASSGILR